MRFKLVWQSVFAITAFIFTISTIASLVQFLSHQHNPNMENRFYNKLKFDSSIVWTLCGNLFYVYLFIFQHSFMAGRFFKHFVMKIGLEVVQRSVYVLCSSLALKLLITKWQIVDYGALWFFDTRQNHAFWWTSTQYFGWMIVFSGCIMMDWGEMLGMKQIWYSSHGLTDPMNKKTKELQSLYRHMRHPSFIGFSIIFWIHPHMTLDRFVLAVVFTFYMLGFFTIDKNDYAYQRYQLLRKRRGENSF